MNGFNPRGKLERWKHLDSELQVCMRVRVLIGRIGSRCRRWSWWIRTIFSLSNSNRIWLGVNCLSITVVSNIQCMSLPKMLARSDPRIRRTSSITVSRGWTSRIRHNSNSNSYMISRMYKHRRLIILRLTICIRQQARCRQVHLIFKGPAAWWVPRGPRQQIWVA